jgi:hypothetical protein
VILTTAVWFADPGCTLHPSNYQKEQKAASAMQFSAASMKNGTVILSSTNNQVGYAKDDNALVIKFIPGASLPPT